MNKPIKVLIVDDSQLIRQLLIAMLSSDSNIEVVGAAIDPYDAREKIKRLKPDVLTLDIEMPRMDGITFLSNLMRLRPMPVIMISTMTEKGADITLQALELGAIDYITKPKIKVKDSLPALSREIISKIKLAAKANISVLEHNFNRQQFSPPATLSGHQVLGRKIELIAIGASTGGTEAIKQVLLSLPKNMPPIVIVQHMPPGFTTSFAQRLNALTELDVKELTKSRQPLKQGEAYIANGAQHMVINSSSGHYIANCTDTDLVNRHKPSVDVLFDSIADNCSKSIIAVLLTGMGSDGAAGMKRLYSNGAITIAQNESTSVVWGMPRAAIEMGAAGEVLPLQKIGQYLVDSSYN